MAITFPKNPVSNQTINFGSRTWRWNGFAWDAVVSFGSGSGSGLESVGVSGGTSVSTPNNLIFDTQTDVLNLNVTGSDSESAFVSLNITGETGSQILHNLPTNHFSSMSSGDRQNKNGRKFLTLNQDGTVGFEYIFVPDVFKHSDFAISISSFKLNNSTTIVSLPYGNADVDLTSYTNFTVSYSSVTTNPVGATISSSYLDQDLGLSDPYESYSTSGITVGNPVSSFPSGDAAKINFRVDVVDNEGNIASNNSVNLYFVNNFYYGATAGNFVDISGNLDSQNFSYVQKRQSQLSGTGVNYLDVDAETSSDQYWYFAYPSHYGTITITKPGAEDVTSTFSNTTFSHQNDNGYTETYIVYRSNNIGAFTETTTLRVVL